MTRCSLNNQSEYSTWAVVKVGWFGGFVNKELMLWDWTAHRP
ncbi:hypothetical protein CyaNS01_02034 [Cyanobium sp. NS01]|nr:hypothetical protein CyaNS01_02034 [Cyanobium sp. NS01]